MTTVRIKRRASTGAQGAPLATEVVNAELAYNEADNILYYGSGGDETGSGAVISIGGPGMIDAGDAATLASAQSYADTTAVPMAGNATAMTGELILFGPPTVAAGAATKAYVDAQVSTGGAVPSDTAPLQDGTAAAGTSTLYARGDHVHPTDLTIATGDATTLTAAQDYADAGDALNVPLAGGTMSGPLLLSADPLLALGAATKQYVDAISTDVATDLADYLPLAGGTLTGELVLAADPLLDLEAATKAYVDAVSTDVAADLAGYLPLTGGALTGALTTTSTVTLAANPVANLEAATKQYVDTKVTASAYTFDVGLTEAAGNVDVIQATQIALGGAMIATAPLITAGADDATIVSPLGLRGQLGADAATLDTTAKMVVPAINEIHNAITQLVGVMIFAGSYDASGDAVTGGGTFNGQGGIPANADPLVPEPLPAAVPGNHGAYLIASAAGPGGVGAEPAAPIAQQDWLVSDGTAWILIPFGQPSSDSGNIAVDPEIIPGADNVYDTLVEINTKVDTALLPGFYDPLTFGGTAVDSANQLTLDAVDGGTF